MVLDEVVVIGYSVRELCKVSSLRVFFICLVDYEVVGLLLLLLLVLVVLMFIFLVVEFLMMVDDVLGVMSKEEVFM